MAAQDADADTDEAADQAEERGPVEPVAEFLGSPVSASSGM